MGECVGGSEVFHKNGMALHQIFGGCCSGHDHSEQCCAIVRSLGEIGYGECRGVRFISATFAHGHSGCNLPAGGETIEPCRLAIKVRTGIERYDAMFYHSRIGADVTWCEIEFYRETQGAVVEYYSLIVAPCKKYAVVFYKSSHTIA